MKNSMKAMMLGAAVTGMLGAPTLSMHASSTSAPSVSAGHALLGAASGSVSGSSTLISLIGSVAVVAIDAVLAVFARFGGAGCAAAEDNCSDAAATLYVGLRLRDDFSRIEGPREDITGGILNRRSGDRFDFKYIKK